MRDAVLRCRVCERTQPLAALSACPSCQGPLDVDYDLAGATFVRADPPRSMWRYGDLLPHAFEPSPVERRKLASHTGPQPGRRRQDPNC